MTKQELLTRMTNIVNRTVKHYKTDLNYDIETVNETETENKNACFIWITRESGTHLINLDKNAENAETAKDYLEAVRYYHKKRNEYTITFNSGIWSIKKVKTA